MRSTDRRSHQFVRRPILFGADGIFFEYFKMTLTKAKAVTNEEDESNNAFT
jgi:hypothetical protein